MSQNLDLKRIADEVAWLEKAIALPRKTRRQNGIREPVWKLEGELEWRQAMLEPFDEKAEGIIAA